MLGFCLFVGNLVCTLLDTCCGYGCFPVLLRLLLVFYVGFMLVCLLLLRVALICLCCCSCVVCVFVYVD